MSGWRFYLFQWCVAALERDAEEVTVNIQTSDEDDEEEEESAEIGGASGQNFERDLNPRYPEAEKDYDSWIERPFGFHGG